jgi:acyl-CoA thioesterase
MSTPPGDLSAGRITPDNQVPLRFHAELDPGWNILFAFGGSTMGTAMQAARAALTQPEFVMLSANASYLSPVKCGPVVLDARRLRAGKGAEQISVDVSQGKPDQSLLHLVASFGPRRETDTDFTGLAAPDVPSHSELSTVEARSGSRMAMVPYYHSIEARPITPDVAAGSRAEPSWRGWYRLRNTPRLPGGELDPAAYACACDMIGPALRMARGRSAPPILLVSLEIALHILAPTEGEWLLQDTQILHAGNGYVTGIVHLWDEEKRLVAHALQRAVIRPRAF